MSKSNQSKRNLFKGALFAAALLIGFGTPAQVYAQTAPIGPAFPAPGGTSFGFTGDSGLAGGATLTLDSDNDFASVTQLWWGPSKDLFSPGPGVGSAMDGTIDSAGESMSLFSLSSNIAVWTGTTTLVTITGTRNVETRFTATILSGSPGFIVSNTVLIDPTIAPVVGEITADPFQVNLLFEARFAGDTIYTPFKTFFDANCTAAPCTDLAQTSVQGGLFYTPVPPVNDFDADGMSDILWRNTTTGSTRIWLMDGASVLTNAGQGAVPTNWVVEGLGDFDGDTKADILWRNTSNGNVRIWRMDGTSVLSNQGIGFVPAAWIVAGLGDFTGEGKADILWRNTGNGANRLWLMDGSTVTSKLVVNSVPVTWAVEGVGDLGADGKADILWRHTTTGATRLWQMNANTVLLNDGLGAVPVSWAMEGLGDFNGDGSTDILWRNTSGGATQMWQMDGATPLAKQGIGTVPTTWLAARMGDYDGSGTYDILWRNSTTGANRLWLMDGFTVTSMLVMTSVPTAWVIQ